MSFDDLLKARIVKPTKVLAKMKYFLIAVCFDVVCGWSIISVTVGFKRKECNSICQD